MQQFPVKRILLIDDEEDSFIFLKESLGKGKRSRYAIAHAETFERGLKEVLQENYDAILLDYTLNAGHTGLEFLKKAIEAGCQAPFIILTSRDDPKLDMKLLRAGAMDYICKNSINLEFLERALHYAIERKALLNNLNMQYKICAKISADFAEFFQIVALDFSPHLAEVNKSAAAIEKVTQNEEIKNQTKSILRSVKAINSIIQSFHDLDHGSVSQ